MADTDGPSPEEIRRIKAEQLARFQRISAGSIYVLHHYPGNDCGCIFLGCRGFPRSCNVSVGVLPRELSGIIPTNDYFQMINELNECFANTHFALMPWAIITLPFVCPFILATLYKEELLRQRKVQLRTIFAIYNGLLAERGYFWSILDADLDRFGIAILKRGSASPGMVTMPRVVPTAPPIQPASHFPAPVYAYETPGVSMVPISVQVSPTPSRSGQRGGSNTSEQVVMVEAYKVEC